MYTGGISVDLKQSIRVIENFPKEGISFKYKSIRIRNQWRRMLLINWITGEWRKWTLPVNYLKEAYSLWDFAQKKPFFRVGWLSSMDLVLLEHKCSSSHALYWHWSHLFCILFAGDYNLWYYSKTCVGSILFFIVFYSSNCYKNKSYLWKAD